jgi:nucleoside 2-deoxyribosyltransferase
MITVIESPNPIPNECKQHPKIFLAGSIEMGSAENWQFKIIEDFKKSNLPHDLVILNPRRKDWDSSWKQDINNPQFNEQVNWELDMIEESDLVIFNFDPNTKSPITLMELGFVIGSGKCGVVLCPEGFWRRGNVDIITRRSNQFIKTDSYEDFFHRSKWLIEVRSELWRKKQ